MLRERSQTQKHTVGRLKTTLLLFVHLLKSIYKFRHKKLNQVGFLSSNIGHLRERIADPAVLTALSPGQDTVLCSLPLCLLALLLSPLLFAFPRWSGPRDGGKSCFFMLLSHLHLGSLSTLSLAVHIGVLSSFSPSPPWLMGCRSPRGLLSSCPYVSTV